MPLPSFRAVADVVAAREVDVGVLPIESSLVGPVAETHDLLYDAALAIVGQTVLPVDHYLAAPEQIAVEELRASTRIRSRSTSAAACWPRSRERPRSRPRRPPTRRGTWPSSATRRTRRIASKRAAAPTRSLRRAQTRLLRVFGSYPE